MDSVLPTLPPFTDRHQAVDYLLGRINYERSVHIPYGERVFKLDRMYRLAERLGNPHAQIKIIHITGSKGKGSTSSMLASMLMACGFAPACSPRRICCDLRNGYKLTVNRSASRNWST